MTGLPWRNGDWFVGQVDRVGALSEPERADARERGDGWAQRSAEGGDRDFYGESWAVVAALRERLQVEHREPLPNVEPADLDALDEPQVRAGAVHSSTHGPSGDQLGAVSPNRESTDRDANRDDMAPPPTLLDAARGLLRAS